MACSSCCSYVAPRNRAAVRLPARTRPLGRFHQRCSRGPARGALRYVPSSASAPRPTSTTGATRTSSAPAGHVSSMARLRAVGSPPRCQARWRALSAHVARALVWTLDGCSATTHCLTRSYRRVVPSAGVDNARSSVSELRRQAVHDNWSCSLSAHSASNSSSVMGCWSRPKVALPTRRARQNSLGPNG